MKMRPMAARPGSAANVLAADIPGDGDEEAGFRGFDPLSRFSTLCFTDDGGDDDGGGNDDADDDGDDKDDKDDALAKVTANNAKLTRELKEARAAIREAKAAEDERRAKEAEAEEEAARKKGDFEKTEQRLTSERDEARDEGFKWRAKYEEKVIDLELGGALDKSNVKPELREAATVLLQNSNDFEVDDDGNVTIDGKPAAEFVETWAKSKAGKAFVRNGSSGGGADGGDGGNDDGDDSNPWEPGKISLGKQAEILKTNREKARRLAAVHGVKIA